MCQLYLSTNPVEQTLKDPTERVEPAQHSIATQQAVAVPLAAPPPPDAPLWVAPATVGGGGDPTRQAAIKEAMRFSWDAYEKYAWGSDELKPLSRGGKNLFGATGATIIDSMDTLYIMGLQDEFDRAVAWVANSFVATHPHDVSVFETVIRDVGGLLAAHDLSGHATLLEAATHLTERLLPAWRTPTGIPLHAINLATQTAHNPGWTGQASALSELGTQQMEMLALSWKSGNPLYGDLAEGAVQYLADHYPGRGMLPVFISPSTGKFTNALYTMGALGDSYYEYLLKVWIQTGKEREQYRAMWEEAMDDMMERLVHHSAVDDLTFVGVQDHDRLQHKMEHLACFVGGMLALGVHHGAVRDSEKAARYMDVAKAVGKTCYAMYSSFPCGLAPEFVAFDEAGKRTLHTTKGAAHNLLRPEAIETWFYLWRITGDEMYREWGWAVFQAFETHSRTAAGYAGIQDVTVTPVVQDDTMQSYFLAETLKYLYLLFSPSSLISLDDWVFNTEAHPLKIWT